MTFLVAAAGTGGHVFPGLAVGESLLRRGVPVEDILYLGSDRLESKVYPEHGFPFLSVPLRGLSRSLSPRNLTLPWIVYRARNMITEVIKAREIRVALAMGGYITVPTALSALRCDIPLFIAEQNAVAGLANRFAGRWADRRFVAFPETRGLGHSEWVGNPLREMLGSFDRKRLRGPALAHYELAPDRPIVGVFGGSLGAGMINEAVARMAEHWQGDPIQILHLTGRRDHADLSQRSPASNLLWHRVAFEDRMDLFYASCDLVVARSGGAVAELIATSTPSLLIPGEFSAAGHQQANAAFLQQRGAALVLPEAAIGEMEEMIVELLASPGRLADMASASQALARTDAADVIASAMLEVVE